jgi:hypothetical protein
MSNWIDEVMAKWRTEGVKLNPPATILEIEKTETALNYKFPDDFKEFYLAADGFSEMDWQEHMFTFWPLKMIVEEYEVSDNKNFLGFSDYFLAASHIGFNRNRSGIFKYYGKKHGEDGEYIADSFANVVGMINASDDLIY